jgi:hypothetical protein
MPLTTGIGERPNITPTTTPAVAEDQPVSPRPPVEVNPVVAGMLFSADARGSGVASTGAPASLDAQTAAVVRRLNPLFMQGPTQFLGEWRLKKEILRNRYGGLEDPEDFGRVSVPLATGQAHIVRDNQFITPDGGVGLWLVPVGDKKEGAFEGPGFKVMDAFLRARMKLGAEDAANIHKNRIYAGIVFWHPENFKAPDMKTLATAMLATEHRETHRGAYLGNGETTNSPEEYHEHGWDVKGYGTGYPAHVYQVSLEGVDQGTYNWQGIMVDKLRNKGVKFPPDYKNDIYRITTLNTALMDFRDWILGLDYLRDDASWKTYCAEHKEAVEIIRANVPFNEASFKEIFGGDPNNGGAALWKKITQQGGAFKEAFGVEWDAKYETNFVPLWKLEGLTSDQIRPWKDLAEYQEFEKARLGGPEALRAYKAAGKFMPLAEGQAMLYRSETTEDLTQDFMESYSSFKDVGGIAATATLLGFKDTLVDRMKLGGADKEKGSKIFMGLAGPIIKALLLFEAMVAKKEVEAPLKIWAKGAAAGLTKALGGDPTNPQDAIAAQVNLMMPSNEELQQIDATPGLSRDEAYAQLKAVIAKYEESARDVLPGDATGIERNGPPGLITRAVQNPEHHPINKFIQITYLCDAVHYDDLVKTE